MKDFLLRSVGHLEVTENGARVVVEKAYIPALAALDGFSHVNILWWFSRCDSPRDREALQMTSPYRGAPEIMGIFATRSPQRPNPIALSVAQVLGIDHETGVIDIDFIDAESGSPVLDLKPYTPSLDRVDRPEAPDWCAHWPSTREASADYDWSAEFTF